MTVGLVIPAFGRLKISHVAFTGYAWLISRLSERGITTRVVVIADDENLDLADELSFETLERQNVLGDKINAGIAHLRDSVDFLCITGSDNWLHPDLFLDPDDERVVTGARLTMIDVESGRAIVLRTGFRQGLPPWIIPTALLPPVVIPTGETAGIEGHLVRALADARYDLRQTHSADRVDFKTDENMTPYVRLRHLGDGEVDAWTALARRYPEILVRCARKASEIDLEVAA